MNNIFCIHIPYLGYVLRHKWFVLVECWKRGLYWRGFAHDMSKFLPSEWFPYAYYFYGGKKNREEFQFAFFLHKKRNRHHSEWWVEHHEDGTCEAMPIQEPYLTEMICDLIGTGKAKGRLSSKDDPLSETREFWKRQSQKTLFHIETRREVDKRLSV